MVDCSMTMQTIQSISRGTATRKRRSKQLVRIPRNTLYISLETFRTDSESAYRLVFDHGFRVVVKKEPHSKLRLLLDISHESGALLGAETVMDLICYGGRKGRKWDEGDLGAT